MPQPAARGIRRLRIVIARRAHAVRASALSRCCAACQGFSLQREDGLRDRFARGAFECNSVIRASDSAALIVQTMFVVKIAKHHSFNVQ
ncbi:hypothetical protein [Burkholderia sp. ABCPW 111]|uniref:hypothetical protein n=1 Tax=Burkholderia sp. ABCPW 111 TaxID=1820025 RepID=UPI000AA16086|nr:hypothetical protein [Burkholderia sp. ABCPW 111]